MPETDPEEQAAISDARLILQYCCLCGLCQVILIFLSLVKMTLIITIFTGEDPT